MNKNANFLFNFLNMFIGVSAILLPTINSNKSNGIPKRKTPIIYGIKNEPPPFCAAIYGNLQIFPIPTAEAIAAKTNAFLLDHFCGTYVWSVTIVRRIIEKN